MARSSLFPPSVQPGKPILAQCPKGWATVTFGDILDIVERPIDLVDDVEYQLVTAKRSRGGVVARSRLLGRDVLTKTQFQIARDDFLMSNRQIIHGGCGIVPAALDGAAVSNEYSVLRPKPELSLEYLGYFSHSIYFQQTCFHASVGVDVEKMIFDCERWLDFKIHLPPLPEQRRIAEILSSVDDAIAATRAVIEQTKKVKQGVLERLLTKGIGHTRFKQTEIGEIPEGWETRALGDVAEFVNGRGFKPHEWELAGLPIIRIQNLNGGQEFNYFNGTYDQKLIVEPGDLLFAWSGSRGTSFGPHIWNGSRGLLNYHTWRVKLQAKKDRDYLFYALQFITKRIEQDSHGASALVHMQKAYIVNYLIPYPPESERRQISQEMSNLDSATRFQVNQLEQQLTLKSALMSDLLTGRKRVTDTLPLTTQEDAA